MRLGGCWLTTTSPAGYFDNKHVRGKHVRIESIPARKSTYAEINEMKRLEPILFRFACLAAGCGFLFCVVGIFIVDHPEGKIAAATFSIVGPIAVMAIFYAVRWALTGRLRPWVPN
jgi:hypothetical protein